jgi:hypothetical protein
VGGTQYLERYNYCVFGHYPSSCFYLNMYWHRCWASCVEILKCFFLVLSLADGLYIWSCVGAGVQR